MDFHTSASGAQSNAGAPSFRLPMRPASNLNLGAGQLANGSWPLHSVTGQYGDSNGGGSTMSTPQSHSQPQPAQTGQHFNQQVPSGTNGFGNHIQHQDNHNSNTSLQQLPLSSQGNGGVNSQHQFGTVGHAMDQSHAHAGHLHNPTPYANGAGLGAPGLSFTQGNYQAPVDGAQSGQQQFFTPSNFQQLPNHSNHSNQHNVNQSFHHNALSQQPTAQTGNSNTNQSYHNHAQHEHPDAHRTRLYRFVQFSNQWKEDARLDLIRTLCKTDQDALVNFGLLSKSLAHQLLHPEMAQSKVAMASKASKLKPGRYREKRKLTRWTPEKLMETLSAIWHAYRCKMIELPMDWLAQEIDSSPTAIAQMFDRRHQRKQSRAKSIKQLENGGWEEIEFIVEEMDGPSDSGSEDDPAEEPAKSVKKELASAHESSSATTDGLPPLKKSKHTKCIVTNRRPAKSTPSRTPIVKRSAARKPAGLRVSTDTKAATVNGQQETSRAAQGVSNSTQFQNNFNGGSTTPGFAPLSATAPPQGLLSYSNTYALPGQYFNQPGTPIPSQNNGTVNYNQSFPPGSPAMSYVSAHGSTASMANQSFPPNPWSTYSMNDFGAANAANAAYQSNEHMGNVMNSSYGHPSQQDSRHATPLEGLRYSNAYADATASPFVSNAAPHHRRHDSVTSQTFKGKAPVKKSSSPPVCDQKPVARPSNMATHLNVPLGAIRHNGQFDPNFPTVSLPMGYGTHMQSANADMNSQAGAQFFAASPPQDDELTFISANAVQQPPPSAGLQWEANAAAQLSAFNAGHNVDSHWASANGAQNTDIEMASQAFVSPAHTVTNSPVDMNDQNGQQFHHNGFTNANVNHHSVPTIEATEQGHGNAAFVEQANHSSSPREVADTHEESLFQAANGPTNAAEQDSSAGFDEYFNMDGGATDSQVPSDDPNALSMFPSSNTEDAGQNWSSDAAHYGNEYSDNWLADHGDHDMGASSSGFFQESAGNGMLSNDMGAAMFQDSYSNFTHEELNQEPSYSY
ncbi:hypothetical protein BT63DRAFT_439748, partial [Microthyrium microscopicum]